MLRVDAVKIHFPHFSGDYDLRVPHGDFVAVIGPSGGGKTSFFNALSGFVPIHQGSVSFDGFDFTHLEPAARPCATLFQDHNLLPHLTARANVGLGLAPSLNLNAAQWQKADAALAEVGLADRGSHYPDALSGGQRQRVALARALVRHKPLLILDEPFGALDPGLRKDMIRLVDRLRRAQNLTVLMSLHTPEDAIAIADRMIFIAEGRIQMNDAPERVLSSDAPAIKRFLGR